MIVISILVFTLTHCVSAKNGRMPPSRPFLMGFTPLPYDYSIEAVTETYRLINGHGDMICHHFDGGVPWQESYDNSAFHPNVEENIGLRLALTGKGKTVYLAVTPLTLMRNDLAGMWAEEEGMERTGSWAGKRIDEKEVIAAYINYCRRMVDRFRPAYLNYGIEVNMLAHENPEMFEAYLEFLPPVYNALKSAYPGLEIFLSIQIDTFAAHKTGQIDAVKELLRYSDIVSVSTYPFMHYPDPATIPAGWFEEVRKLGPSKPFAVAETTFPGKDTTLSGGTIRGNEAWQEAYMSHLLADMERLDAVFVTWFLVRDYDALWKIFERHGAAEFTRLWVHTGLIDGGGRERKSLTLWDAWLALPVRGSGG